jgi:hypothetical protein
MFCPLSRNSSAFSDIRIRLQLTDRYANLVEEHASMSPFASAS